MMDIYKLTLTPLASFRTPLQSDTLFGHLMWALRYTEGEKALSEFLDRYRAGAPPLLLSAGFPAGYLPAPVLKPAPPGEEEPRGRYLPLAAWRALAPCLSVAGLRAQLDAARDELRALGRTEQEAPVTHTAVDRLTGSALTGRLFISEETFYKPGRAFEVWHKLDTADGELPGRLERWWQWVARNGFGRAKSSGRGAFRLEGGPAEAAGELPRVPEANGFCSLSAWVPRPGDPTDVTYRTRVKRGKLAEAWALPNPWKKPLLMLEPGATARLHGEPLIEWYGQLVPNVHRAEPDVVQYGYAFPLAVRLEGGA